MSYVLYLWYVVRHKWYVMFECFKHGLYWQGIVHDWSKFRPCEFFPYVNHFYGKKRKETQERRDRTGYSKADDTVEDLAFDFAWLLHQKINKHHWQWWLLPEDEGPVKVLEMPVKYWKEMVCDWLGAARAQGVGNKANNYLVKEWFMKNRGRMKLNPSTEAQVRVFLKVKGD